MAVANWSVNTDGVTSRLRPADLPESFGNLMDHLFGCQPPTYGRYGSLGLEVGRLVDDKNAAYGDSVGKAPEFLQLLYPNGVQPDQYGNMLTVVRIFDKLMRSAVNADAFGENPYRDIAGYALLAVEAAKSASG